MARINHSLQAPYSTKMAKNSGNRVDGPADPKKDLHRTKQEKGTSGGNSRHTLQGGAHLCET